MQSCEGGDTPAVSNSFQGVTVQPGKLRCAFLLANHKQVRLGLFVFFVLYSDRHDDSLPEGHGLMEMKVKKVDGTENLSGKLESECSLGTKSPIVSSHAGIRL